MAHADKGVHVDEVAEALLGGEVGGRLVEAVAQEVVGEQAVEALAAPGLVLDVLDGVDGVELVEVGDAGGRLEVQARLLLGVGGELALDAAHAREHGVEVLEHILLRGAARDGGRCRLLEQRLEGRCVLLDGEVRGSEVLSEELVGEAEQRLVLFEERKRKVASVMASSSTGGHGPGAMRMPIRLLKAQQPRNVTYQQQVLAVPNLGQLVVGHGGLGSAGYEARGKFSVRTIQGEGLGGGWESQVAVEVTMTLGD